MDKGHCKRRNLSPNDTFILGSHSKKSVPLVNPNIVLLPLHDHVKLGLGLMENFVKNLDKEGADFKYLVVEMELPYMGYNKLKTGVFIGL